MDQNLVWLALLVGRENRTDMHWQRLRSLDVWTALFLLILFCNSPPWSKRFSFFSEPKSDDSQFYEGEFLNILFKKLKCILDQVGSGYSREYNLSRCVMCFVLYGAFWSVWCVLVCMVCFGLVWTVFAWWKLANVKGEYQVSFPKTFSLFFFIRYSRTTWTFKWHRYSPS